MLSSLLWFLLLWATFSALSLAVLAILLLDDQRVMARAQKLS